MNKGLVLFGGLLAAGGLAIAASKLNEIKNNTELLSVDVSKLYGVERRGKNVGQFIRFKVDLKLSNPGTQELQIQIPVVKIYYNDKEVAKTVPSTDVTTIKRRGTEKIKGVTVDIPFTALISSFTAIISDVNNVLDKLTAKINVVVNGTDITITKPLKS